MATHEEIMEKIDKRGPELLEVLNNDVVFYKTLVSYAVITSVQERDIKV